MEDKVIEIVLEPLVQADQENWRHTWKRVPGDEPDDNHRRSRPTEAVVFDLIREEDRNRKNG